MTDAQTLQMVREKQSVAFSSLVAALLLTGAKLTVGLLTHSLAITAEALHSGLDLLAALLTVVAVHTSDRPADDTHHYGHEKVESMSALAQAGLLIATCGWIGLEAARRIWGHGHSVQVNVWSFGVMAASILIDFGRSRALYRVAHKYSSQALEADALHFSSDIYSSIAVIVGLIAVKWLRFPLGDPLVALGVAALVLVSALRLLIRALRDLLDRAQAPVVDLIRDGLSSTQGVQGFRNLRIRHSGRRTFVDVAVKVDTSLPIAQAHEVSERVETEIRKRVERADVVVHVEPSSPDSDSQAPSLEFSRDQVLDQIEGILRDHLSQFADVHEVTAETNGAVPTITFHLVMPDLAPVRETHAFCDHLEQDLRQRLAGARISIHVEPCDHNCGPCQAQCAHRSGKTP